MKALFLRRSGAGYLLLGLTAASLALIYVDSTSPALQPTRYVLSTVVSPGNYIVESPYRIAAAIAEAVSTRSALLDRLEQLERRNLQLARTAQQFQSLKTENDRMRELLASRARLPSEVTEAELVGVVPTPDTRQVVIDKGTVAGVGVGQAVIDAEGLFGQIVESGRYSSRVLLITDVSHAVPVEVTRNGVRSIASGTGRLDLLRLEDLPVTADLRQGDQLVSSGLGGRFPRGYPVGTVQSVLTEPTRAFVQATVKPSALLHRSRHLLVILDSAQGEGR